MIHVRNDDVLNPSPSQSPSQLTTFEHFLLPIILLAGPRDGMYDFITAVSCIGHQKGCTDGKPSAFLFFVTAGGK